MSRWNRMLRIASVILGMALVLAGSAELIQKHGHGPLECDHDCPACRIAGSSIDPPSDPISPISTPVDCAEEILMADPAVIPQLLLCAALHLRGPPAA